MIELELPYPPTVNHYWGQRKCGGRYMGQKGLEFRKAVKVACLSSGVSEPLTSALFVEIEVYPPDRRKRDLDNVLKATMDALEHAEVFIDDYQVSGLHVERFEPINGGLMVIRISEID